MKSQAFQSRLKAISKSTAFLQRLTRNLRSLYRKYQRGIRTYSGIPGRIHYNDDSFYNSSPAHYISVGQSALENIVQAFRLSKKTLQEIRSCLDFACGYGRITRILQAGLPNLANLDVCDIVPEAVDFCAEEFGATPIPSKADISKVIFPRKYDLIWIGSLLTHLDQNSFTDTLKISSKSLKENGIVVFTTHGPYSLGLLGSYGIPGLSKKEAEEQLQAHGFYFAPYPGERAYGISLNTEDFVRSLLEQYFPDDLKLLFYKPRGWDNHQDVFACQKMRLSGGADET